jgi:hypothetical protein
MAADARRLAELSMPTELARETAAQIDGIVSAIGALTPLTDSSGGTANNTIAAIPAATAAVTDTTAASLTSTNASIDALKNAVADLAAKVNAIINAV